jgi:hypothetical protein
MTTNSFGLLTADGHYIRFDNPSNTRVVEIVRKSATAPTRVKVIGTANGDVAVVESLVPAEGGYAERSETSTVSLDVRYGDDRGKLIISDSGLRFENVSHADKSQNWTYSQIREFHREDNNKVKIDPYRGDTFEFRLDGPKMADSVYKTISDRIVAARGR